MGKFKISAFNFQKTEICQILDLPKSYLNQIFGWTFRISSIAPELTYPYFLGDQLIIKKST